MKTKVLKYGAYPRENDVVSVYMDLERVNDKVFTCLDEKSEFSRDQDRFWVVLNVNGVYFTADYVVRTTLARPDFEATATAFAVNFFNKVNEIQTNGLHLKLLYVRVYEVLGINANHLHEYRRQRTERVRQQKEAEQQAKEAKDQRQAEEEKQKREAHLQQAKSDFLDGKMIATEDFLDLAKQAGMEIHIRTIGTFRSKTIELDKQGSIRYYHRRGKRAPQLSGCHETVRQYEKLTQPTTAAS